MFFFSNDSKKLGAAGLALSLVSSVAMAASATPKSAKTLKLDSEKSKLSWVGKKVTGQHNGHIKLKGGEITLNGEQVAGGNFEIDMTSLVVDDLKDPGYNAKLTGHLKSDDFFAVEKHPVSTFKITQVKPAAKGDKKATHQITGDLTIKGITHPVTFPAVIKLKDGKGEATAQFKIDRTKYDIRYGSGKFFQGLGDKMIYDDFEIDLKAVTQ